MSSLLKEAKYGITRLSLGLSPQNLQNFQGRKNSVAVVVLEKSV